MAKVRVRELITRECDPEDCQEVYEGAVDRELDAVGVILRWE